MDPNSCCTDSPAGFAPRPQDDQRIAAWCRALSHPHRVYILRFLLAQQACFAGDIAQQLPIAASTVSQHLAILTQAGLIRGEVDGPRRCYCAEPQAIASLRALLEAL